MESSAEELGFEGDIDGLGEILCAGEICLSLCADGGLQFVSFLGDEDLHLLEVVHRGGIDHIYGEDSAAESQGESESEGHGRLGFGRAVHYQQNFL